MQRTPHHAVTNAMHAGPQHSEHHTWGRKWMRQQSTPCRPAMSWTRAHLVQGLGVLSRAIPQRANAGSPRGSMHHRRRCKAHKGVSAAIRQVDRAGAAGRGDPSCCCSRCCGAGGGGPVVVQEGREACPGSHCRGREQFEGSRQAAALRTWSACRAAVQACRATCCSSASKD